jgi:hypothetical protein
MPWWARRRFGPIVDRSGPGWPREGRSSVPDEPGYDPEARRAFWRWYLSEAIPSIDQDWHH